MNMVTKTFKTPYYVVIFISKVNSSDFLFDEANLDMVDLAPRQPGFLGMDRGRMEDGLGFSISYWESLEAIELWRENQKHTSIQKNARKSWLSEYTLRTAKVEYDFYFNMNKKTEPSFKIEDQALLYSYIAMQLNKYIPDKASQISRKIIKTMANERGKRMALRCLKDNQDLSVRNFLLYSEWDNNNKYNIYEPLSYENGYSLNVVQCGWHTAWQENDLLDYSIDYCLEIDKELMRGFNSNLEFNVTQFLTTGNNYCDFRWADHAFKDKADLEVFNVERAKITSKVTKGFLYHTAHLYSCASKIIKDDVSSPLANQILLSAIAEYKKKFSTEKSDLVIEESSKDFSTI